MTLSPQFIYFDNKSVTTDLIVTTNTDHITLNGMIDSSIIDMQISLNGSPFKSDNSLFSMSSGKFTIPNLLSFPEGLELENGLNVIKIRSIDMRGSVSPVSVASINRIDRSLLSTYSSPPSSVSVERLPDEIELSWKLSPGDKTSGFNVYASTGSGGTGSGYLRVNASTIMSDGNYTDEIVESESFSYENTLKVSGDDDLNVIVSTIDPVSTAFREKKVENVAQLVSPYIVYSDTIKVETKIKSVLKNRVYKFRHNRSSLESSGILNNDVFSSVTFSSPLYYVVTSVVVDSTSGEVVESTYSPEVLGSPVSTDTSVKSLLTRGESEVIRDYINEIQKTEPTLSLIPASSVREVHIEPFSNEVQKVYYMIDFVHRSKSFLSLMLIDDPTYSGTSVPVQTSVYKQNLKTAMSLSDDVIVQQFIDSMFESLAENMGIRRNGRKRAAVELTFYTQSIPSKPMYIQQGASVSSSSDSSVPTFIVQSAYKLDNSNSSSYYNYETKRYEMKVYAIASEYGTRGNVSVGTLDRVSSGANGFRVINESPSYGGKELESNASLAMRAMRNNYSLDTGTYGGIERVCHGVDGVRSVNVITSGHQKMIRDYDDVRKKHIGGKVDVWVKGTIERVITETFSFSHDIAKRVRFDVVDPTNLIFRARDSRLTVDNPIQEVLYNIRDGYGVRNFSSYPYEEYDLTGVSIIDYNTIKINNLIPQPKTFIDDYIDGDYRYRNNSRMTLSVQPVERIESISGQVSGDIDSAIGYKLYKTSDPMMNGESIKSNDYVEILQVDGVPSSEVIPVNDEQHVISGFFEVPLNNIGINYYSIRVYSFDRNVLYNGPGELVPDYLIVNGSQTKPIKIIRSEFSQIGNGDTISVDYEYNENFKVTYIVNDVIHRVQSSLETSKHATCDVLAKASIENRFDVEAVVKLSSGADKSRVDIDIRTGIFRFCDNSKNGRSIHVSDVIGIIESVTGVDYVMLPLTKMAMSNGSIRVRDKLQSIDYTYLQSLSKYNNAVYIIDTSLQYSTYNSGGNDMVHYGVFSDDEMMKNAKSVDTVGDDMHSSFIIGSDGAVIQGYSDDDTLSQMFGSKDLIASERLRRTANKVVVSLNYTENEKPNNKNIEVTYVVNGDNGVKDITTNDIQYITPGAITITYV